jgi:hypothetical protein
MFFIPGIVITVLTFPGVIVHELAHQLFCRLFKVPVFKVVYFQAENPAGYVLHEKARNSVQAVFISTGPFILNTILGFLIALPAALQYKLDAMNPLDFILLYLGVSIAMHAFPSTGDAQVLWKSVVKAEDASWLSKILVTPIVGFIYLGAMGSFFWLDFIYGIGVAVGLPWMMISLWV